MLRDLRKKIGVTQTDIANEINATQGAVGHWESGFRKPSMKNAKAVKKFFAERGYSLSIEEIFCL